ncbi:MAG: 50S ribosomal protein L10 [Candidatus Roizmanbacteria bacterium]|nr:MAG: 50S ribosomal protein L10 [Candidatus Roizmanbacteria bacterium]
MVNTSKKNQVQSFIDLIEKNKNFVIVSFEKTLHTTLESLRKDLRQSGAKIKIIKNSLFQKALNKEALKNKNLEDLQKKFKELQKNSAILMLGDQWNKGLSAFYNFAKKETFLSFKIGFLDDQVYMNDDLKKIAQLPSKEELLAKVIGGLKTPISNLNYALKFNMQKFVYILTAKSKQTN